MDRAANGWRGAWALPSQASAVMDDLLDAVATGTRLVAATLGSFEVVMQPRHNLVAAEPGPHLQLRPLAVVLPSSLLMTPTPSASTARSTGFTVMRGPIRGSHFAGRPAAAGHQAAAVWLGRVLRRMDGAGDRPWRRGLWALGVITPWVLFAVLLGVCVRVIGAKSFAGMPFVALAFGAGILGLAIKWRRRLEPDKKPVPEIAQAGL